MNVINRLIRRGLRPAATSADVHEREGEMASQIEWKNLWKPILWTVGLFLFFFWIPVESSRFLNAVVESLALAKWYAREHVVLCLIPAFFIAGGISCFVSQGAVMKYLGAQANKVLAYSVASVSGTILAVCSCTILPLFAGIWKRGAGLGPATAFLYSGPAINVLAIILTARVLGPRIGIARAVGAIIFSIVIGLLMHSIFRKEEEERAETVIIAPEPEAERSLKQNILYFASMVGVLVFATWGEPAEPVGLWNAIFRLKWIMTGLFSAGLGIILVGWFHVDSWKVLLTGGVVLSLAIVLPQAPLIAFSAGIIGLAMILTTTRGESQTWFLSSWGFAKQILPLLFAGVLVAGFLLGGPGSEGLIPSEWVSGLVGGNSVWSNLFASVVGTFMYFATLTEVPILQGLMGSGMGEGPALALLLAGPALSLPNMLVIRSIMGTRKTLVFVGLVVVMSAASGMIFGAVLG